MYWTRWYRPVDKYNSLPHRVNPPTDPRPCGVWLTMEDRPMAVSMRAMGEVDKRRSSTIGCRYAFRSGSVRVPGLLVRSNSCVVCMAAAGTLASDEW